MIKRKRFSWRQLFPLSWYMIKNRHEMNIFIFLFDLLIYISSFISITFFVILNDKDTVLKACGWVGSMFFAVCAFPQAWKSFKDKHSDGSSFSFLMLWLFGEIFTIIYVIPTGNAPLLTNYFINTVLLVIIIRYKLFPKDETEG